MLFTNISRRNSSFWKLSKNKTLKCCNLREPSMVWIWVKDKITSNIMCIFRLQRSKPCVRMSFHDCSLELNLNLSSNPIKSSRVGTPRCIWLKHQFRSSTEAEEVQLTPPRLPEKKPIFWVRIWLKCPVRLAWQTFLTNDSTCQKRKHLEDFPNCPLRLVSQKYSSLKGKYLEEAQLTPSSPGTKPPLHWVRIWKTTTRLK